MTNDDLLRRVPAQNLEAERAVLGACLYDPAAFDRACVEIGPQDFYRPAHEGVFRAMGEVRRRGDPLDAVTLVTELRDRGALEAVGGPVEVGDLSSGVVTGANVVFYARLVRDASRIRGAMIAAAQAQALLMDAGVPPRERLERAERLVHEATREDDRRRRPATSMEVVKEAWAQATGPSPRTIPTGIPRLDALTLGLPRGEMTILGGRPGQGKSTFALWFACCAASAGHRVGFFSLEMAKVVLGQKLLSAYAGVPLDELRGGRRWSADLEARIYSGATAAESLSIRFDDTPAVSTTYLRAAARGLKSDGGLDLVVLDYLQLMDAPEEPKQKRRHEVLAGITRELKFLAQELDVALLACAQLNREVENRPKQRPRLSDLREGGTQEQDAALVLLLCVEPPEEGAERKADDTSVIVAKNRFGPTGEVAMRFDRPTGRIEEAGSFPRVITPEHPRAGGDA